MTHEPNVNLVTLTPQNNRGTLTEKGFHSIYYVKNGCLPVN